MLGKRAAIRQRGLERRDREDMAGDPRRRHAHRLTDQGAQQRLGTVECGGSEGQGPEAFAQRLAARQPQAGQAAGRVVHAQAFQQVIDLVERDSQRQGRRALDVGYELELANPAGRQRDAIEDRLGKDGFGRECRGGDDQQQCGTGDCVGHECSVHAILTL